MTKEQQYQKLVDDHKRLIEFEASKYSRFIPLQVVEVEAYKLAKDAARSFNPDSGAKFSTHLVNQLKKLSRLSTKYGGLFRIPENKQFRIQKLNKAEEELRNEYGHDATLDQLSQFTGMPIAEINSLKQARKRDVNISNLAYAPVFIDNENDNWVHFVYHDLPQKDKFIFEHKTGFGGKPILTNEQIGTKLKLSASTVSNRVKFITDKLSEGWQYAD